ncbi:MAG: hypothetical protein CMJ84_11275 [Planctomycetes bacterium]|nr:hypothetical protein [Planctomycetota bacterium]MDP6409256.1 hypothetical protein [Planctomycetota bacterium]
MKPEALGPDHGQPFARQGVEYIRRTAAAAVVIVLIGADEHALVMDRGRIQHISRGSIRGRQLEELVLGEGRRRRRQR